MAVVSVRGHTLLQYFNDHSLWRVGVDDSDSSALIMNSQGVSPIQYRGRASPHTLALP